MQRGQDPCGDRLTRRLAESKCVCRLRSGVIRQDVPGRHRTNAWIMCGWQVGAGGLYREGSQLASMDGLAGWRWGQCESHEFVQAVDLDTRIT